MRTVFLFFFISTVLSSEEKGSYCDLHTSNKWNCQWENGGITVTLDCSENLYTAKGEKEIVWLWSWKFPDEMKTLIIRNCEKLDVYTELATIGHQWYAERVSPANDFQVLKIMNVSDLHVSQQNLYQEDPNYYYYNHDNQRTCLPSTTIFENVKNAQFNIPIFEQSSCSKYNLTSLKLINVSFNHLNRFFQMNQYIRSTNIKEFVMDTVHIEEIDQYAIAIDNEEAFIIMKNSIIGSADNTFIYCNGKEVVITNNTFQHFYGTKSFILKADRIVFEENDVAAGDNIFDFSAADIKITDNIFHHVYENSFSSINSSTAIQKNISSSYNFSNNLILSVEPGAFYFKSTNPRQNLFDQITISNNSINCACRNMYWFHSIAEKYYDFQKNFLRTKWVQKKNNNKCLNIPNCTVGQVLKRYPDLCDEDFDCSERFVNITTESNCTENKNPGESLLENFLSYNNEIGEKNSKLLKVLINNIEEGAIWGDSNVTERNKNNFDFLVRDDQEGGSLTHYFRDMNVSKTCLVVLTCLFCVAVLWVAIIKISKVIPKILATRKSIVTENEMTQSSVAELCARLH